ncbi:MAG: hypothetical protein EXR72_26200 [Myxococcales bacterium]|nr:hypothetical protein [Myxococcales bacterium]
MDEISHNRAILSSEGDRQVEQVESTTPVTQYNAGWLSVLGLGVTEDGKTKSVLGNSASRATTAGSSVCAHFLLNAQPGESYTVDIYFDKVFGTFAFMKVYTVPKIKI